MISSEHSPVRDPCPECGALALVHDRVRSPRKSARRVDVYACKECGDWWFEWDGKRLTIDRLSTLGLLR